MVVMLSPWNPRKGIETQHSCRWTSTGYPHGIPERGLKRDSYFRNSVFARYPHGIPERGLKHSSTRWPLLLPGYPHGIPERGLKHRTTNVRRTDTIASLSPWNPRKGIETPLQKGNECVQRLSPWNPRKGIETPHDET